MSEDQAHDSRCCIIADYREARSGVIQVLQELEGVSVTLQHLPVGDYQIDGKLIVERKSFADLINSIKTGRLFQQASRLASNPIHSALILEGNSEEIRHSKMRREAIQGALISLTIVFGIPLLRSLNPAESAHLLLYAAKQIRSTPERTFFRRGKRPKGKRKLQLHILQGLPGVGPERAAQLLDRFGSVEAVITAPVEQLKEISGIGLKTALAIRRSVGR